jgi:hypothetical protein
VSISASFVRHRPSADAPGGGKKKEGETMKYALLIYQGEKFEQSWEKASEDERRAVYAEHDAFAEMLKERGALVGGHELALRSSATTVRKNGSEHLITDGPFAEVAEQLSGFYFVEAHDLDEALEYAKALPAGLVEVRPIVESAA